jgi:heptosyltransferase-3
MALPSAPRVLIIATQQIGDVLLTTPLIGAVRRRWPQATIDLLGHAGTLGMLQGHADLTERIEVRPGESRRATLARLWRLWRRYDLALITRASDRAHLYGLAAARVRCGVVGPDRASNWWKRALCRHVVASDERVHTVDEKLALLTPWPCVNDAPAVVLAPAATPLPAALTAQIGPGAVVVHVPSMWRYKQWPLAHYRVLIEALLAEDRQVVLTGSAGAHDQSLVAPLRALAAAPALIDATGQLDFGQLATLLRGAAAYVGPDTSITHLAAACGTPVIALFGPTDPRRWGPWPVQGAAAYRRSAALQIFGNVRVLQGEARCAPGVPCGRSGCEDHNDSRSDCLETGLAPQRVLIELRGLLQRDLGTRPSR